MKPKINFFLCKIAFILLLFNLSVPVKASEILTTLPPLAGLVHWLDPDADVRCLLPSNADPHHFQLSPRQVEALQLSKLFIRSSQDDGHWSSLQSQAQVLDLWPLIEHHGEHEQDILNHAWLNPQAVQQILPQLAQQLATLYPNHQQKIQQKLSIALKESEHIWQAWRQLSLSIELDKHGVMMQHPSWSNLFQALQIPIRNTLESEQHGHEYGPRKLETALQQLQKYPSTLLIADSNHSSRALQWLQNHHPESSIVTLDALGTCGETWPELMQRNIKLLQP